MSRFQQFTLLILALILVAVIALVAVVVFKPPAPVVIATSQFSADQLTGTWAVEYVATHQATFDAIATTVYACMNFGNCPTETPP